MRLLNTKTYQLRYYMPNEVPDYAILSHRWCTPSSDECTYADTLVAPLFDPTSPARQKPGFAKVVGACRLAASNQYEWIWIDSCCIDKSSSAELQESIDSMWRYYEESNVCYVYLEDFQAVYSERDQSLRDKYWASFCRSIWFKRGWTLQELLAPIIVEFYDQSWDMIGTKSPLPNVIAEATRIHTDMLLRRRPVNEFCAAERLSWAAHRKATREEDAVYSLLGLFDVSMPLLYGEGSRKAFTRLQTIIYNTDYDQSLLLFRHWCYKTENGEDPDRY